MDLVNSYEMRSHLAEGARITQQTGHEAGFRYYLDTANGERYWSPVFEGVTDELPLGLFTRWLMDAGRFQYQHPLLTVHYHPGEGEIVPSSSDLMRLFLTPKQHDAREIVATATITNSGAGRMVLSKRAFDVRESRGIRFSLVETLHNRAVDLGTTDPEDGTLADALTLPGYVHTADWSYLVLSDGPVTSLQPRFGVDLRNL